MHQIPKPASASPIAVSPATSDEANVTFDNRAKRNSRTKIVFCIAQRAPMGSCRKNTGANCAIWGMP